MSNQVKSRYGFSSIELLLGLALSAIIAAVTLPDHLVTYYTARESETKANLHEIQTALERYGTNNLGEFPDYILGGDAEGWHPVAGCKAVTQSYGGGPPRDLLIDQGYLSDYPRNPFLSDGDKPTGVVQWTGSSMNEGNGDVRFGFYGDRMGNCLDDPRVLWSDYSMPTNYQYTMRASPAAYTGVLNGNSPNSFYTMGGMPEWSRVSIGASDTENDILVKYYWPGEFFYRAGGQFSLPDPEMTGSSYGYIWDWPYSKIDKYMLGCFGSLRTDGLDVIRLTTLEGEAAAVHPGAISGAIADQYYQDHSDPSREASHPDFDFRMAYSNPEVFGGGAKGLMPQFPYYEAVTREWMFGAPDGYPDGVILVLTTDTN